MSELSYSISVIKKVNNLCLPFFQATGVTYFHLCRAYNDGTAACLFTKPDVHDYLQEENLFFSRKELQIATRYNYISLERMSPTLPYPKYLKLARDLSKLLYINESLTVVYRYKDFIDIICIGSDDKDHHIMNYESKTKNISRFIMDFRYKANFLIRTSSIPSNRVFLPPWQNCLSDYKKHEEASLTNLEKPEKFWCEGKQGECFLSERQVQCLVGYARGKSAKEIAKILKISHRTVEIHLMKLREKLGCLKRSDFFDVALHNPFLVESIDF